MLHHDLQRALKAKNYSAAQRICDEMLPEQAAKWQPKIDEIRGTDLYDADAWDWRGNIVKSLHGVPYDEAEALRDEYEGDSEISVVINER